MVTHTKMPPDQLTCFHNKKHPYFISGCDWETELQAQLTLVGQYNNHGQSVGFTTQLVYHQQPIADNIQVVTDN